MKEPRRPSYQTVRVGHPTKLPVLRAFFEQLPGMRTNVPRLGSSYPRKRVSRLIWPTNLDSRVRGNDWSKGSAVGERSFYSLEARHGHDQRVVTFCPLLEAFWLGLRDETPRSSQPLQFLDVVFEAGDDVVLRRPAKNLFSLFDYHRLLRRTRPRAWNNFNL